MRLSSFTLASALLAGQAAASPALEILARQESSASMAAASSMPADPMSMAMNASATATATASASASTATTTMVPQLASNETDIVSNAKCQRQNYTIMSSANRTVFDLDAMGVRPENNQSRITALNVEFVTQMSNFTQKYITGHNVTNQTFEISGIFCSPKENAKTDAPLLVFVHGIGFDNFYWNFYKNGSNITENAYSFAYAAAELGYSSFRFDRLGTGNETERPDDGYNVAQGPTEVGILTNILEQARQNNTIGGQQWNKTVLIGHSYGSAQSQAVSYLRPDLVDGVVLTGFSTYSVGASYYILSTVYEQGELVQPNRWANLSQDWLITATNYSNQQNFANPAYVLEDANALARSTEQPVTQGALFTIGSLGGVSNFTGPVLIATGSLDFIFVFDSANASAIVENSAKTLYPMSSNSSSYVPADVGHGIAFHQQAPEINRNILKFLQDNSL